MPFFLNVEVLIYWEAWLHHIDLKVTYQKRDQNLELSKWPVWKVSLQFLPHQVVENQEKEDFLHIEQNYRKASILQYFNKSRGDFFRIS